jgi:hypothetical protein
MCRLSVYLDTLGDQIHAVEHEIGEQFCPKSPPKAATITQLQSLDYLRQSLEDLAMLALLLGKAEGIGTLPATTAADISAKLNLNDTKALMCSQLDSVGFGAGAAGSGDLDLF